jgi:hypothetical protein
MHGVLPLWKCFSGNASHEEGCDVHTTACQDYRPVFFGAKPIQEVALTCLRHACRCTWRGGR